jgi:NAD-dependent DNA ligase
MPIKSFLIKTCPVCDTKLTVEKGQKDGVIKLICPNKLCDGSAIKKLQKGIEILEIKGLGPANIEKIYNAGITSSIDLFNPEIFNEENLLKSGEFQEGKTLSNLLESVFSIKEIDINKAIYSLQIMVPKEDETGYISIGRSLSLEIGKLFSGVKYDFEGLSIQVREEIIDTNSELYLSIYDSLKQFENFGIKIKYFEKIVKPKEVKKLTKKVHFQDEPTSLSMTKDELLEKLSWSETTLEDSDMLVVEDETKGDLINIAKEQNIKITTYKKIKLLYL